MATDTDPWEDSDIPDEENETSKAKLEELLDHKPLTFGKFKGNTPDKVSQMGYTGKSWLKWAYETVTDKDVCSAALYRACGGKGSRAGQSEERKNSAIRQAHSYNYGDEQNWNRYRGPQDNYNQAPVRRNPEFDDMDDDIPF